MGNTANFNKQGRNNLFKEEEKELCYCNDSKKLWRTYYIIDCAEYMTPSVSFSPYTTYK